MIFLANALFGLGLFGLLYAVIRFIAGTQDIIEFFGLLGISATLFIAAITTKFLFLMN